MLDVNSVPNGVGMARPPANVLPSGALWQAMQSPARARYSPLAMIDGAGPLFGRDCAHAGAATNVRAVRMAAGERRLIIAAGSRRRRGGRSCPGPRGGAPVAPDVTPTTRRLR